MKRVLAIMLKFIQCDQMRESLTHIHNQVSAKRSKEKLLRL